MKDPGHDAIEVSSGALITPEAVAAFSQRRTNRQPGATRTPHERAVRRLKHAARKAGRHLRDYMRSVARNDADAALWLSNKGIRP